MALLQSAVAAEAGRAPAPRPAARRVAVDVAVVGADDEQPAAVGGGALDGAAHVHAPAAMARPGVERRERAVLGAEVERAVDEQGGGLGARADAVAPDALAVGAAHGDHDASERGDVETLLVQRGTGRQRRRDLARPAALARLRVERDDAALGGLDEDAVVVDDGRELRQRVQAGAPHLREGRSLLRLRVLPVVRRVEAPARPGDGLVRRDLLDDLGIRARVLGGSEVRDGAAVHVLGRAQRIAEESASADHDDRGEQQRAPAASPAGARIHRRHGRTALPPTTGWLAGVDSFHALAAGAWGARSDARRHGCARGRSGAPGGRIARSLAGVIVFASDRGKDNPGEIYSLAPGVRRSTSRTPWRANTASRWLPSAIRSRSGATGAATTRCTSPAPTGPACDSFAAWRTAQRPAGSARVAPLTFSADGSSIVAVLYRGLTSDDFVIDVRRATARAIRRCGGVLQPSPDGKLLACSVHGSTGVRDIAGHLRFTLPYSGVMWSSRAG